MGTVTSCTDRQTDASNKYIQTTGEGTVAIASQSHLKLVSHLSLLAFVLLCVANLIDDDPVLDGHTEIDVASQTAISEPGGSCRGGRGSVKYKHKHCEYKLTFSVSDLDGLVLEVPTLQDSQGQQAQLLALTTYRTAQQDRVNSRTESVYSRTDGNFWLQFVMRERERREREIERREKWREREYTS